jgi:replicative DNA helicase
MRSEEAVIFCLLYKPSLMMSATVTADDFTVDGYRNIFQAMTELQEGYDAASVLHLLEKQGLTNSAQLAENILSNSVASPARFDKHCEEMKNESIRRRAMQIAYELQLSLKEREQGDHVGDAIQKLMAIGQTNKNHSHTMRQCVRAAVEAVEAAMECDGMVGIPTGLKELDECLGGFHDTDLVVIGARPAMGKTALMVSMANSDVPCGIISAEQDGAQLAARFISSQGSVHSQKMRTATLQAEEWTRFSSAAAVLSERQAYVNDEGSITLSKLTQQAREWKFNHGIKILYVDYIQKIKTREGVKKYEQVSEVTSALKNLAKELQIPVVALAQVKRDVDNREDKQPKIGDLSDASEIEKEADVIMTLYREEATDPDTQRQGIADISIEKNRHGPTGHVSTQFIGKYFQFKDFDNVRQLRA